MDPRSWRVRLEAHDRTPLGSPEVSTLPTDRRAAVAELLRRYAGGEAAEQQIAGVMLRGARDEDDRVALEWVLRDEARHAELLASLVRSLGGAAPPPRPEVDRLAAVFRVLGFVDTIVAFHLLEVCVATAYRVLRAANRMDATLRAAFGQILGDEALHCAFHGERIASMLRTCSPARRWRMRVVHLAARRLLVTSDRSVAPKEVYLQAMGIPFAAFKQTLWRSYERAYRGELAYLRTGVFR
jgi:hypothetical protein